MNDSVLAKLWKAIQPPPAVARRKDDPRGMNPKQKKIIWGTTGTIVLILAGWFAYDYVSSAPQRAQKLFAQAMSQMTPGQYPEAIILFTKALEIDPRLGEAYLERGNAQNALGQKEGAFSDYERAIEAANLPAAYTARGRIYMARKELIPATNDFSKSIGAAPNSDAYFQRGQVHALQSQYREAIDDFDHAIQMDPAAPFVYLARGQAKLAMGDERGAAEDKAEADRLQHRTTQ